MQEEEALEFKIKVYQHCQRLLSDKMGEINRAYAETKKSLESESRSTAGDKHETGRAMIQLEQEKMSRQFQETQKQQLMLQRVPFEKRCSQVQSGALVQTHDAIYFIATGMGPVMVEDRKVYVLAPASPLAQSMLGKMASEKFSFKNNSVEILGIY